MYQKLFMQIYLLNLGENVGLFLQAFFIYVY